MKVLQKLAQLAETLEGIAANEAAKVVDAIILKIEEAQDKLVKVAYIRKRKGKWVVLSHKGKVLGTYKTKAEAEKRLRQIEFFKHNK